jgi:sorting nexin-13
VTHIKTLQFPQLAELGSFPGKKTFNNLNAEFLDKRKRALNTYMQNLLHPEVISQNTGLDMVLHNFVTQKDFSIDYERLSTKVRKRV